MMKVKLIWKILLIIGLCPFIAPFAYYLIMHMVHNHYSWTLLDMIILWSYVYWPTYVLGISLVIVSIFKLKK